MIRWLEPVSAALDRALNPVTFFFRDDDVGWCNERLFALLDRFADFGLHLDLAVIPSALEPVLARRLQRALSERRGRVAAHQHGFAHVNHESIGRSCEFGPARGDAQQQQDIDQGWQRLQAMLGPRVQRMFTPPWNRCTLETARCLSRFGFRVLSRDASAQPFHFAGLTELPIHLDWHAHRHGARLSRPEWGTALAGAVAAAHPIGIRLHHARLDDVELGAVGQLLALLARHGRAGTAPMIAVAELRAATAAAGHHPLTQPRIGSRR